MMSVKHFRLEASSGKEFLLVAVPFDFARLASHLSSTSLDGLFLIALAIADGEAHVETDPAGWVSFDRGVMLAHFYLREHLDTVEDRSVLYEEEIARVIGDAIRSVNPGLLDA